MEFLRIQTHLVLTQDSDNGKMIAIVSDLLLLLLPLLLVGFH
jgi:hypothetical protein